ncbi:ankyrin repeat-containing domain protein [Coprinopsis sp. MPI-PUGE-AT-0042]|nr:ankyrin repeat-containing domain protein [Coprinopsis sp. MPI-PUGE-AT-0042]
MSSDPKRRGSASRGQNSTTSKKGGWETELAGPPSECSPITSGSALVHSAQIHGGVFAVVGRDSNTTINNLTYNFGLQTAPVDVLDILNSLSLPNFRDIQLDTLAKATDGTCIWLTQEDIVGYRIPGAGKTVLASIVIRYLEGLEKTSGGVICVAYVYLRYSEPLAIRDILESLVKQIVERHTDLIPLIEDLYARHKQEETKPSRQDLLEVLGGFVRYGKTLFFVLDALDEMRVDDRPILITLLASLDAKLFITSRPAGTASAAHFLRHSPEVMVLLEGTDLREKIAETIHQKSGGMFLHAKLQLEALRNCVSAFDVEETLQAFPTDIKAIYAKTWEQIIAQAPKQSNLAKLVLLWITHADGEMTIDTLRRAVATCPETYAFEPKRMVPEALLLSVCCGLVSVDKKTRLVRLIHYTTREAILPRILDLFPVPHAPLGHVCIVHLTKCGLQRYDMTTNLSVLLHIDALLAYAYRSWASHVRHCGHYAPITSAAADLVLNCASYPLTQDWYEFGGPIHVAAFYGLEDLIPLAAQLHSPNTGTTGLKESPLIVAVQRGHIACAKALLSLPGIDVNLCDENHRNALMLAASYGHIECARVLAEVCGIDANEVDVFGNTALTLAAARGHTGIVKLLVRLPDIDINMADWRGWTPLMHAVYSGHTEIVEELLSGQEIDVNCASFREHLFDANGEQQCTALVMAASKGHISIVKQLLKIPGIDVNAVSNPGGKTAMSCALAKGHREIVELLAFPDIVVPDTLKLV